MTRFLVIFRTFERLVTYLRAICLGRYLARRYIGMRAMREKNLICLCSDFADSDRFFQKIAPRNFRLTNDLIRFSRLVRNISQTVNMCFVGNFIPFYLRHELSPTVVLNMWNLAQTDLWSKLAVFSSCPASRAISSRTVRPMQKLMSPWESAFNFASDRPL